MVILFRFIFGKGGAGKQKFFNPKTQEFVGRLWETGDSPLPASACYSHTNILVYSLDIAIQVYSCTV